MINPNSSSRNVPSDEQMDKMVNEVRGEQEFTEEQAALKRLKQFEADGDYTSKAYDSAKRHHEECLRKLIAAR